MKSAVRPTCLLRSTTSENEMMHTNHKRKKKTPVIHANCNYQKTNWCLLNYPFLQKCFICQQLIIITNQLKNLRGSYWTEKKPHCHFRASVRIKFFVLLLHRRSLGGDETPRSKNINSTQCGRRLALPRRVSSPPA